MDHVAQQYNLFYLKSLSALQFIYRKTAFEGGKSGIAIWLNIKVIFLKIYG